MSASIPMGEPAGSPTVPAPEKLKDVAASSQLRTLRLTVHTAHGVKSTEVESDKVPGAPSSDVQSSVKELGNNSKSSLKVRIAKHAGKDAIHSVKIAGHGIKDGGKAGLGYALSELADSDELGRIGGGIEKGLVNATLKSPKAAGKTLVFGVKATRGTVRLSGKAANSAKRMFSKAKMTKAERKAARAAAHEARSISTVSQKIASAASRAAAATAAKIAAFAASVASVPLMVVAIVSAIAIALVTMITSFLPMFHDGAEESHTSNVTGVPAEYRDDVIKAGNICELVTAPIIAAQIYAESNWNPAATSSAGAQGIAQFMPDTWKTQGKDGDGDGVADIENAHDQIYSEGMYMCSLAESVKKDLDAGKITGDSLQLTIAAYNAGLGNVEKAGTIPPYSETQQYVEKIIENSSQFAMIDEDVDDDGGDGGEAGTLEPRMKLKADKYHVDIEAMGISSEDTTYQAFQCTWWASVRRAKIGKPVDGYMGNGGQWDDSARRLGYKTGKSPKAGDVIVFEPGVLGADAGFGHVAIVEEVKENGDILISEAARSWMAVATRNITAAQLKQNSSGVTFIH